MVWYGCFFEIGKYDLLNNIFLGMVLFFKNVFFYGILLDVIFEEDNLEWIEVLKFFIEGIKLGN